MTTGLRALAELLEGTSGIVIRDSQLPALEAALGRVAPDLRPADVVSLPAGSRRDAVLEELVDVMTVQESFFLRHADELAVIDWAQLQQRAARAGRETLRVWSAGCATGEEPYSLALLATEALGPSGAPDVLASDVASSALRGAEIGVYGERALRLVDTVRRRRWFTPHPRGAAVGPELRAAVRLRRHNLVADPAPPEGEPPFDLIVCRNVLIYFRPEVAARTAEGLRRALCPGGMLVLGTADRLGVLPTSAPAAVARRPSAVGPLTAPARPVPDDAREAFEAGTRALASENHPEAIRLLRRALYLDPTLSVAALQLGRAHERLGDVGAARRAYGQALQLAQQVRDPAARLYDRVGAGDVIAACEARLRALE